MPPPIGVTVTPSGLVAPLSSRTLQPAGRLPPPCILSASAPCCCASSAVAPNAQNARSTRARFIRKTPSWTSLVDPVVLESENALHRTGRKVSRLERRVGDAMLNRRQASQVHHHGVPILLGPVREICPRHGGV